MKVEDYMQLVDYEEIYRTIIDLEGPKYPNDNWEALEHAKEYIIEKLETYGVEVELHQFYLEDFDCPFTNIIGHIGNKDEPAILIGSHYDTVRGTPGANDNLSAVAVSLEVARVLSEMENPPSVQIAVFTLEEGHPTKRLRFDKVKRENGWFNENNNYVSAAWLQFSKDLSVLLNKKYNEIKEKAPKIYEMVIEEQKEYFTPEQMKYAKKMQKVILSFDDLSNPEMLSSFIPGSTRYAEKVLNENIRLESVIVYDCLGWISNQKHTQKPLPIPEELYPFTQLYRTEHKSTIGNFIAVIGSQNSKEQLEQFLASCQSPTLEIPFYGLHLPMDFNTVYQSARDMIRSDHAAFWEAGIPGIFISDTANFRSPYYHTGEDRSFRLNYEFLGKVAQATIKTILNKKS